MKQFEKNEKRCERVMEALSPSYPGMSEDSIIADALTDLMHSCDAFSLDFDSLLLRAIKNHERETLDATYDSE